MTQMSSKPRMSTYCPNIHFPINQNFATNKKSYTDLHFGNPGFF